MTVPEEQRRFAAEVVRRLRDAGFVAYWAGGCVRDQLLGRVPKDYDVATNATPPEIRRLFGRKRTLAIGAAFGVITVLGPKPAGMIEVATFREDAAYSDGRHPDRVTFSSAREDALRRDFTINGLFYDPLAEEVIDFVGGREDLTAKIIRAIGQPRQRIGEDKLRMLRAIRFAATFGFEVHPDTLAAIREMAPQITVVSAERIAMEMRRLLVEPRRAEGVGMMIDAGLADAVLPEVVPRDESQRRRLDHTLDILAKLSQPGFPLALGTLLHELTDAAGARGVCRRWRLSNKETDRVAWLVENHASLENARSTRFSALQPLLVAERIEDLLALHDALALDPEGSAYCRLLLAQPREMLDPPPLLTGDDLIERGFSPGPRFGDLLERIRNAQLDKEIRTRAEALAMVGRLLED